MSSLSTREHELAASLVRLADTLEAEFPLADALTGLTRDCVRLLGVRGAALLVAEPRGVLRVAAASSELAVVLATAQVAAGEGPGIDSYRTGLRVDANDSQATAIRWPELASLLSPPRSSGGYALPMRLRQEAVGALLLFGLESGSLDDAVLLLGQSLADMATITILRDRALVATTELANQLQQALSSRVTLEQAKGVLAERGGLSIDDAFRALRKYARDHNERLEVVSRAVIDNTIDVRAMLR